MAKQARGRTGHPGNPEPWGSEAPCSRLLNFLNDAPEQRRSQALALCEGTSNCKPSKQRGKQYARRNSKLNNHVLDDCCVEGGANARRDGAPMRKSTPR